MEELINKIKSATVTNVGANDPLEELVKRVIESVRHRLICSSLELHEKTENSYQTTNKRCCIMIYFKNLEEAVSAVNIRGFIQDYGELLKTEFKEGIKLVSEYDPKNYFVAVMCIDHPNEGDSTTHETSESEVYSFFHAWKIPKYMCNTIDKDKRENTVLELSPQSEICTKLDGMRICGGCNKVIVVDPGWCSRCRMVYYCGRDCQVSHWKLHKKSCKTLRRVANNFNDLT